MSYFSLSTKSSVDDPEKPLLRLSKLDFFRVADAFEGVQIFGATGSGKTSGSGAALARAYLRAGWGGIVCCAKPGEADLWRRYCRETGREASLIVFDASGKHRFNFLQYEMQRSPDAGGLVMNLVALLSNVIDAANGRTGQSGGENQFWQKAMKEALTHALGVLWAAYGHINLFDLFALLQSRPMTPEQANTPEWQQRSFMAHTLIKADASPIHPMHPMDYRSAFTYLTRTLSNPDARTTGNLIATISADLAPLMQGTMRELFCTGTTLVPEMTHHGAVIILDFPVKTYAEAGLLAQHIFKYLWQRATERRGDAGRPVFSFCDEYQLFISPYDAEYQSTARSSRAATVCLTQNLPGLYNKIGGPRPEHAADALLGNFQTKIFHANGCSRTNQWAADTIGKTLVHRWNASETDGWNQGKNESFTSSYTLQSGPGGNRASGGGSFSAGNSAGISGGGSRGYSEQMDYQLQPSDFAGLRKGGKANKGQVDAYVFQGGRMFRHSGRTVLSLTFRQGA